MKQSKEVMTCDVLPVAMFIYHHHMILIEDIFLFAAIFHNLKMLKNIFVNKYFYIFALFVFVLLFY